MVSVHQELRNIRGDIEIARDQGHSEEHIRALRRGWIEKAKQFFRSKKDADDETAPNNPQNVTTFRKKAREWVLATDAQLRHVCGRGLQHKRHKYRHRR
jgi:hypothetical protein